MSPPAAQPLDTVPAQSVRQLRGVPVEEVARWAQGAGQRLVTIDLAGCRDKKAALQALADAFALPQWFGLNLDALYDALTDLDDSQVGDGLVVLLTGVAKSGLDADQRRALLQVFRDAAADYVGRALPFRVLYR
jgi:RNAse (barnase) inhibitor barstar